MSHWAGAVSTRMIPAHSALSISLQHPLRWQQHLLHVKTKEWEMDPQTMSSRSTYKSALGLDSTAPTKPLLYGWGPRKFCSLVVPPKKWKGIDPHRAPSSACNVAVTTAQTAAQLWHTHMQSLLQEHSWTRMLITTLKYIQTWNISLRRRHRALPWFECFRFTCTGNSLQKSATIEMKNGQATYIK